MSEFRVGDKAVTPKVDPSIDTKAPDAPAAKAKAKGHSSKDEVAIKRAAPDDVQGERRMAHLRKVQTPEILDVLTRAKGMVAGDQLLEPEHVAIAIMQARNLPMSEEKMKQLLDSAKQYGTAVGKGMSERIMRVLIDTSINTDEGQTPKVDTLFTVLQRGTDEYCALVREIASSAKVEDLLTQEVHQSSAGEEVRRIHKRIDLPLLNSMGKDLVLDAQEGRLDVMVGRDEEVEQIVTVLGKRQLNNPLLLGEPGVGKTAIIEGLAQLIHEGRVPEDLQNARIYELKGAELVSRFRSDPKVIENIAAEIAQAAKMEPPVKVLLCIDEFHALVRDGGQIGLPDALKPYMARGTVTIIGMTTDEEYRKFIKPDEAFTNRCPEVQIKEPSKEKAVQMVLANLQRYADFHGVDIDAGAAQMAVELAPHNRGLKLPRSATDFFDLAGRAVKQQLRAEPPRLRALKGEIDGLRKSIEHAEGGDDADSLRARDALSKKLEKCASELERLTEHAKREKALLDELQAASKLLGEALKDGAGSADEVRDLRSRITEVRRQIGELPERLYHLRVDSGAVAAAVARFTGKPLDQLQVNEESWRDPSEALAERVFGQPEGVEALASSLRRDKAKLKPEHLPIDGHIFFGPTGVGKTELVKAVADQYFDGALRAVNCNELDAPHKADLLFGAPPGYVGSDKGSSLAEFVRKHKRGVILLDEIEKGDPSLVVKFMQILDQGFFLDNDGKPVDCSGILLVATSNLGAAELAPLAGDGQWTNKQEAERVLKKHVSAHPGLGRPEVRNRFQELLLFNPLSKTVAGKILDKFIWSFDALNNQSNRHVWFTPEAREAMLDAGFSPADGARHLDKKALRPLVFDPYIKSATSGKIKEGAFTAVDLDGDKFVLRDMTDEERGLYLKEQTERQGGKKKVKKQFRAADDGEAAAVATPVAGAKAS